MLFGYSKKIPVGLIILALLSFNSFTLFSQELIVPDTIRSCKTDSLLLTATEGYDNYLWSNGDTTRSTWVSIMGDYIINASIGDTVFFADSVFVGIVDAEILEVNDTVYCADTIILYGSSEAYEFLWLHSNEISDSVLVSPRDTAWFYAIITDTLLPINHCLDSVIVPVESIIFVDSLIQTKMGCPDSAVARAEVYLSGGFPPYSYTWSEGVPNSTDSSKVFKLTDGNKNLVVVDSIGCILKYPFEIKAFPLPEIEITSDPTDTVYLQKPFVNFFYENISYDSLAADTFYLNSFWWDFLGTDSVFLYDEDSPTYIYSVPGTYEVYFHYRTFYGCEDTGEVHIPMKVEPVKLKASSVITANDDSVNDYFLIFEDIGTGETGGNSGNSKSTAEGNEPIDLTKYFLSNNLVIFNRYGQKVYEASNYNNDWDAKGIKDGVYFYILECKGYYEDKTYKGSVTILTNKL
ncbi:MAG: gliding motility-associated C-terminal domain-containing protein [Bacteroidetes bacterium]|nr:gliding motility-associated C-terminal domain-containing protein [Bacteroidota bacterium]